MEGKKASLSKKRTFIDKNPENDGRDESAQTKRSPVSLSSLFMSSASRMPVVDTIESSTRELESKSIIANVNRDKKRKRSIFSAEEKKKDDTDGATFIFDSIEEMRTKKKRRRTHRDEPSGRQKKRHDFPAKKSQSGDDFSAVETVLNTYSKPKTAATTTTTHTKTKTSRSDRSSSKTQLSKPRDEELEILDEKADSAGKRSKISRINENAFEEKEKKDEDETSSNTGENEEERALSIESDEEEEERETKKREDEDDNFASVEEISEDDSLRKNTEKWYKKTKQFPDRLGSKNGRWDEDSDDCSYDAPSSSLNAGIDLPLRETIILEDKETLDYVKRREKRSRDRRRAKRRGSATEGSRSAQESGSNSEDSENGIEGAEGSYVRMTPAGIESKLIEIAKRGHTQALQGAAINDLMRINKGVFCDNIDQDPLTNPYYSDPNKTNVDYYPKDMRANYIEHVVNAWIGEDFIRAYQTTETMTLLEQFGNVIKTLEEDNERKKITLKTEVKDLPKIEASYIASFLREPILDLGERRCVAGDCCLSYYLFDHIRNNTALNSSQLDPASSVIVDAENGIWTKKDGNNQQQQQQQQQPQQKGGFILREFLLPAQKAQIETEINMGTSMKEALEKIERRHCILCNRYITTVLASRISAGIGEVPSNTIQDHRNYFDCPGQYDSESMLYFCGDYCGIIGEMVAFKISDYALASIEQFKYNTTTQEEREAGRVKPDKIIRLRSWVEKNLVTGMKKHEEGNALRSSRGGGNGFQRTVVNI